MTRPLQRARELDAQGQHGPALMAYRLALREDPECRAAKVELAGLLLVLGRAAEARDLCLSVLAEVELPAARLNLAGALQGLEQSVAAEAAYRQLLTAEPVLARLGLATSLEAQDRQVEARALLEQLLELEPGQPQARELLLRVLLQLQDWPAVRTLWLAIAEALPPFERTLERAVVHLLFGEFATGWELMEHRLDRPGFIQPVRDFAEPRWDGAPFPGRTLLLHWEQGFGDNIMLLRYAPLAKARGGRVLALVPEPLRTLAATVPGLDRVLGPGDPLPAFDLQLPIFSLPWAFGTRLDSVPATIPYLAAPPGPTPALDPGYRVGLVWAGNRDNRNDRLRSIPLAQLAPLAEVPVAWHSFQVGEAGGLPWAGIRDLAPELPDFAATARALEAMDLVITVDTGVAHLAGALGRPTWLLLPFLPEWRWLLGRDDSPWYPTLRIFRQERANHWPGVLARVGAALLERVRGTC